MNSNITSIILLIASAGMFFGVINPQYQQSKEVSSQISDRAKALENATYLLTVRNGLLAKKNSLTANDVERINRLLPDTVDTIRLTMDINGIAAKNNLLIKKINISSSDSAKISGQSSIIGPDQNQLGSLEISFGVTATYDNFLRFLTDIEQSLRIVDVTSLSVAAGIDKTSYDYSISARTYWLK